MKLMIGVSVDSSLGSYWVNQRELLPGEGYLVTRDANDQVLIKIVETTAPELGAVPFSASLTKDIREL